MSDRKIIMGRLDRLFTDIANLSRAVEQYCSYLKEFRPSEQGELSDMKKLENNIQVINDYLREHAKLRIVYDGDPVEFYNNASKEEKEVIDDVASRHHFD